MSKNAELVYLNYCLRFIELARHFISHAYAFHFGHFMAHMICDISKTLKDLISSGTIVVINHHYQQMGVTLHVLAHTVLLSALKDGDHKVDGELNAKVITLGHIQNFHHASHAQICLSNFLESTKEMSPPNQSSEKISQACFQNLSRPNFIQILFKKFYAFAKKSLKTTIFNQLILKTILSDPIFLW